MHLICLVSLRPQRRRKKPLYVACKEMHAEPVSAREEYRRLVAGGDASALFVVVLPCHEARAFVEQEAN